MDKLAKIIVHGVVQGVGFRYFVFNLAKNYNLNGYTKNLYSGEVEIEVEGNEGIIKQFIREVGVGPGHAHVTKVDVIFEKYQCKYSNFEVKF